MPRNVILSPAQILAEPVRVYIIELLCRGAGTSGDIATMCFDSFGVGWSTVSRHLGALEAAGFVRRTRERAERWYALEPDWLAVAGRDILRLEELWREGEADRRLGVGADLYFGEPEAREAWQMPSTTSRRGLRGRTTTNRAAFGLGRSEDSEASDGGGAFD